MIDRKEIHEKRLIFRRLPDGENNRMLAGRLVREHLFRQTRNDWLCRAGIAKGTGRGKTRAGGAVAEGTTGRFMRLIVVGMGTR